jgi:hypothetical protein
MVGVGTGLLQAEPQPPPPDEPLLVGVGVGEGAGKLATALQLRGWGLLSASSVTVKPANLVPSLVGLNVMVEGHASPIPKLKGGAWQ